LHGAGTSEARTPRDSIDAVLSGHAVPVAVDVGDVRLAPAHQRLPVGGATNGRDPEPRRIVHRVGELRGVPHDLLRHAATIHTGAAEAVPLDDGDAGAKLRRPPCDGETATATADGNQIIVENAHE